MSDMSETPKISIKSLSKLFGPNPDSAMAAVERGLSKAELLEQESAVLALHDINLDIPPQKLQVVMGLSGSGKSTLIRHINRLIEPTRGVIAVDGEDILTMDARQLRDLRRFKMSMVFQKFALLPHRTVLKNVEYGVEIQGLDAAQARERALHWIERVGLAGYDDYYPPQLSGGMQQRVGLARALATDAEILLMDEAFSALDPLIRKDMQAILLELQEELQKTIVFITHDLDEALALGDRIAILRDGMIVQSGDPQEILMRPADDYVADFIKDINRAKCVRMRSIMRKPANGSAGGPTLPAGASIEEALPTLSASPSRSCTIVSKSGEAIGEVTLDAAIDGLTPKEAVAVAGAASAAAPIQAAAPSPAPAIAPGE